MRMGAVYDLTGKQFKAARKKAGLTQRELAELANLHVNSVKRLERFRFVLRSSSHALKRCAVHLPALPPLERRWAKQPVAPARESSFAEIDRQEKEQFFDVFAGAHPQRGVKAKPIWRPRKADRPRCGAKTRKGSPCHAPSRPNGRCRMHGGLSTGAKTSAGRQRIVEAQLRRWARYRAGMHGQNAY